MGIDEMGYLSAEGLLEEVRQSVDTSTALASPKTNLRTKGDTSRRKGCSRRCARATDDSTMGVPARALGWERATAAFIMVPSVGCVAAAERLAEDVPRRPRPCDSSSTTTIFQPSAHQALQPSSPATTRSLPSPRRSDDARLAPVFALQSAGTGVFPLQTLMRTVTCPTA